jgi:hypothetical protein
LVLRRILRGPDRRKDEQPSALPQTADDKRPAAAKVLHNVEAAECADEVDRAEDDLGDEAVGDADGLEDRSAIVEDCSSFPSANRLHPNYEKYTYSS